MFGRYSMRGVAILLLFLCIGTVTADDGDNWTTSTSIDEMTGEKQTNILSKWYPSTTPSNAEVAIGVGAKGNRKWVYLYFSEKPNLRDTENEDGYEVITTRVKYDDTIQNEKFFQLWGSSALDFWNVNRTLERLFASKEILVELLLYGGDEIYFRIPVSGLLTMLESVGANLD